MFFPPVGESRCVECPRARDGATADKAPPALSATEKKKSSGEEVVRIQSVPSVVTLYTPGLTTHSSALRRSLDRCGAVALSNKASTRQGALQDEICV